MITLLECAELLLLKVFQWILFYEYHYSLSNCIHVVKGIL